MFHSDPLLSPLLDSVTCYFGGSKVSVPKEPKRQPDPVMPAAPQQVAIPEPVAPAPPPPPAPTESKMEVQDKMAQQRMEAKKRKGMAASLIAGETGGYSSSATGTGSLLG
jgi:hypothetical protein